MKKPVKIISVFLSLAMALSLGACSNSNHSNSSSSSSTGSQADVSTVKPLYDQGLDIIALMDEMVESEAYIALFTGSAEIQSVVSSLRDGDYTEPKDVYKITVSDEDLPYILSMIGDEKLLEGLSDTLQESLKQKMMGSVISQVNGLGGAANLAAASVFTASKVFVNPEVSEDTIYLYMYENAAPVAVTFIVGEGGAVTATGSFVLYEELSADTEQEIERFFSEADIKVETVTNE